LKATVIGRVNRSREVRVPCVLLVNTDSGEPRIVRKNWTDDRPFFHKPVVIGVALGAKASDQEPNGKSERQQGQSD